MANEYNDGSKRSVLGIVALAYAEGFKSMMSFFDRSEPMVSDEAKEILANERDMEAIRKAMSNDEKTVTISSGKVLHIG